MKLWVVSDLHQDFGKFKIEPPAEADVAILAGDIQNDELIVEIGNTLPTVFVAGNHSFYGHVHRERLERLHELMLRSKFLHVLENEEVAIGGVRFLGCTLWTDYDKGSPLAMDASRRSMNDHRKITWQKQPVWQRFRPEEAWKLHRLSRRWLAERFAEPFDGKTVVVTHHAPSERSVAPKFAGSLLNHAYFSALDAEIEIWRPALWVHGHMHANASYMIGQTHVLANPHGYPNENPSFDPKLVVEI